MTLEGPSSEIRSKHGSERMIQRLQRKPWVPSWARLRCCDVLGWGWGWSDLPIILLMEEILLASSAS